MKDPPRIYPAPEGTISLEWSCETHSATIEIDLGTRSGHWHDLDHATKRDEEETLDLVETAGWDRLGHLLAQIRGRLIE